MKRSLKVSTKWLDFLDGLTELNANDLMWHWMEIYLDTPLSARQSLWVKYTHKKYGEHTHEIMFAEDGTKKLARAYIPPEVIRIPGEWSFQAFIRQYSITDSTKYTQTATNEITFTVASGLPLDGDGAPVTNATIGALYEFVKSMIKISAYELEVLSTDTLWTDNGTKNPNGDPQYRIRILQVDHGFGKIHSIVVEGRAGTADDVPYENIVYSYKRLKSGTVSIILDKKINCRIIIKGEKL